MQRLIIIRTDINIDSVTIINAVEDYWKNIISVGEEKFGDGYSLGYAFPVDDNTFTYCINDDKITVLKIASSYEELISFRDKAIIQKLEEQVDFDFILHDGIKIGLWFKPLLEEKIAKIIENDF